ncbi:unnamed protein product, partial [Urochloa humidicola]
SARSAASDEREEDLGRVRLAVRRGLKEDQGRARLDSLHGIQRRVRRKVFGARASDGERRALRAPSRGRAGSSGGLASSTVAALAGDSVSGAAGEAQGVVVPIGERPLCSTSDEAMEPEQSGTN